MISRLPATIAFRSGSILSILRSPDKARGLFRGLKAQLGEHTALVLLDPMGDVEQTLRDYPLLTCALAIGYATGKHRITWPDIPHQQRSLDVTHLVVVNHSMTDGKKQLNALSQGLGDIEGALVSDFTEENMSHLEQSIVAAANGLYQS